MKEWEANWERNVLHCSKEIGAGCWSKWRAFSLLIRIIITSLTAFNGLTPSVLFGTPLCVLIFGAQTAEIIMTTSAANISEDTTLVRLDLRQAWWLDNAYCLRLRVPSQEQTRARWTRYYYSRYSLPRIVRWRLFRDGDFFILLYLSRALARFGRHDNRGTGEAWFARTSRTRPKLRRKGNDNAVSDRFWNYNEHLQLSSPS